MEGMKKKERSLFYLFLKQVVIMAAVVVGELMLFLCMFSIGLNMGIILPANHTENELLEKAEQIAKSTCFSKELLPAGCEYALFDLDGTYIEGNTDNINTFEDVLTGKKYRNDYKVIVREDGYCVIHYSVQARFANPALHKIFPYLETTVMVMLCILVFVTLIFNALLFGRKLRKKLKPLLEEIAYIKEKELIPSVTKSDIREFNEVLSALNEMKEALGTSLKREWETEQRRKDNISALAHDIKTPLTVIKGNAELLTEETDIGKAYDYASRINENADRIEHYIKLLINVAKGVDENSSMSLCELFSDIKRQSEALCKTEQIPIFIKETSLHHPEIQIEDSERILRAVLNIVANAVEYTDPEKGVVMTFLEGEGILQIKVEDFGTGFSTEALRHATEQFYTEKKERSGEHYGLGLYFADMMAKEHNGKLHVENKADGNGAEVTLILWKRQ